jgi:hypothetical protein
MDEQDEFGFSSEGTPAGEDVDMAPAAASASYLQSPADDDDFQMGYEVGYLPPTYVDPDSQPFGFADSKDFGQRGPSPPPAHVGAGLHSMSPVHSALEAKTQLLAPSGVGSGGPSLPPAAAAAGGSSSGQPAPVQARRRLNAVWGWFQQEAKAAGVAYPYSACKRQFQADMDLPGSPVFHMGGWKYIKTIPATVPEEQKLARLHELAGPVARDWLKTSEIVSRSVRLLSYARVLSRVATQPAAIHEQEKTLSQTQEESQASKQASSSSGSGAFGRRIVPLPSGSEQSQHRLSARRAATLRVDSLLSGNRRQHHFGTPCTLRHCTPDGSGAAAVWCCPTEPLV